MLSEGRFHACFAHHFIPCAEYSTWNANVFNKYLLNEGDLGQEPGWEDGEEILDYS